MSNHYYSSNYIREFNTPNFYNKIINNVETNIGRSLIQPEIAETINFIKNIDPQVLTPQYQTKTIDIMVSTLSSEFKQYDCLEVPHVDTHELLRKSIGISSETGTSLSIYDNPKFSTPSNTTPQNNSKPSKPSKPTMPINDQINIVSNPHDIHDEQNQSNPNYFADQNQSNPNYFADQNQSNPIQKTSNPIQKTSNSISNFLGVNDQESAIRILNPKSFLRKNYMMLDSRYRVLNKDYNGKINKLQWNYVMQAQTSIQGGVNIVGNVRDIVGLRIYPTRIPYVASADNKYSRISVLIEEFSQSFIAHENRKFQFILQSEIDGSFINLITDKFNDGYYHFEKPVPDVNTLTITFGSPVEPIVFDIDRDLCQIDYFSISPLTKITTGSSATIPSVHNLSNGDIVYFSNFNTGISLLTLPALENLKIKNTINRDAGFIITVIDLYSFSIPYNSSNIQNPLPDSTSLSNSFLFDVFYGSKRVFIPIELTYIMPEIRKTL